MALIRILRAAGALILTLGLAACGTGPQTALTELATSLPGALRKADPAASNISATRASLLASGFDQPLIVIGLPEEGTRGGMLRTTAKGGVTFWTSADGASTAMFEAGVLRGTTGLGYDLYSSETSETRAALNKGREISYLRAYRHVEGDGVLRVRPFTCTIKPEGRETITVFDRRHVTLRMREYCIAHGRTDAGGTRKLTNTYWRDSAGPTVWKAEEWVSPELGYMIMERVFR